MPRAYCVTTATARHLRAAIFVMAFTTLARDSHFSVCAALYSLMRSIASPAIT
jgi:hypothetical protein